MAKMERKMTKCVGEVQFPGLRSELIFNLLDLSDAAYQQHEWIEKWEGKAQYPDLTFGNDLEFARDFIDSLGVFDHMQQKDYLYGAIGAWLKTVQEADALYKVAEYLDPLPIEGSANTEYLSSPYLPKLREAAKDAFDIFMANERDDKEFCERVERVKKEHAAIAAAEPGEQSQQEQPSNDWPLPVDKGYCNVSEVPDAFLWAKAAKALKAAFKKWDVDAITALISEGGWKLDKRLFDKVPPLLRRSFMSYYGGHTIKLAKDGACVVTGSGVRAQIKFGYGTSYILITQGDPSASNPLDKEDNVKIVMAMDKAEGAQVKVRIPLREWIQWVQLEVEEVINVPVNERRVALREKERANTDRELDNIFIYGAQDFPVAKDAKGYAFRSSHFSMTEDDKKVLEKALQSWDVASVLKVLAKSGWDLDRRVLDKVPEYLRSASARLDDCAYFVKPRGGLRFTQLVEGPVVDYIRIVQRNPNAYSPSQQRDYVQVVTQSKMLKIDGNALMEEEKSGDKPSLNPDVFIPLNEWLRWKRWNEK